LLTIVLYWFACDGAVWFAMVNPQQELYDSSRNNKYSNRCSFRASIPTRGLNASPACRHLDARCHVQLGASGSVKRVAKELPCKSRLYGSFDVRFTIENSNRTLVKSFCVLV
jgi:hypothetical protein